MSNKLVYSFVAIIIFSILLIGIISPIVLKNIEADWGVKLTSQIELIESKITEEFGSRQNLLLNELSNHKKYLSDSNRTFENFWEFISTKQNRSEYLIALLDSQGKLIEWNYSSIVNRTNIIDEYFRTNETYFISNSLVDYLTAYDSLEISSQKYFIVIFEPLEKNYKIENKYYAPLSITDYYSDEFNTEIEFTFFKEALPSRDGRKHSFPILNNNHNKIGVVNFLKPIRESELDRITANFNLAQSILSVVLFIVIGVLVLKYTLRIKYRLVKFFILSIYFISLRYIILYLNISALMNEWEISNSKYFSSLLGNGIAGSPLELFLSLLALSTIIYLAFKYALDSFTHSRTNQRGSWLKFLIALVLFVPLYLISLRGLGASVKSIILDSSLRYYKESSLFPSFVESFMLLNVLMLGIISFVGLLTYLIIIFQNLPKSKNNVIPFISLFFLFQFSGVVYDLIQKEPQGTPFFRILFILFSFLALFFVIRNGVPKFREYFIYTVVSSILVILLLTQYNSLIERDSLRKTAYNLTRQNEDLLKFSVQETLIRAITDRETVQSFYFNNANASSIAFKLWSNSILQRESLGSSITLLDAEHQKVGSFDFRFSDEFEIDWDKYAVELSDLHEIKIFEEDLIFSDNKLIRGIATIEDVEGVLGYITVSVLYDLSSLTLPVAPDFMISDVGYINDSMDITKLKIYDFHQGTLINSISNYSLSEDEMIAILDAPYNQFGEAWLNMEINNEEHLVFVLKREQERASRVISIALKEKELSWGLFDFFKIFFMHIIIIISLFSIYLFYLLIKYRTYKLSFASKLLISFIFISLIPLVLVSFFFRSLTTVKNNSAIEYKLGKRGLSIEEYLENYSQSGNLRLTTIAEKATNDLGIDFTLYKGDDYIYSSNGKYYDVGLIPKILNPEAHKKLFLEGLNNILVKENIENYYFNSLYYKTSLLGEYHVIKITDGFNKIVLPLAGEEVDVYIFVSYSVGMVIILILGFILTGQISKPIERLKNATRSVAVGDLNVEVKATSEDEVGELVKGFNYMVKELKRSQAELAEFERETAWKEMAKQVAHEIKNPLTPMKLSVQQLIVAHDDKSPKFEELFNKVTKTIINQIETLKNIASEFSSFTRMPNPKVEVLNLSELIIEATNLFSDEKVNFTLNVQNHKIEADYDQLRRVFINLIRNSMQADADKIVIETMAAGNWIVINFGDNGFGISEENLDKIFTANFSTKKYGMGIGLSMAKKTIENMNGEILLKDTNNSGTIFEIKLPLI